MTYIKKRWCPHGCRKSVVYKPTVQGYDKKPYKCTVYLDSFSKEQLIEEEVW